MCRGCSTVSKYMKQIVNKFSGIEQPAGWAGRAMGGWYENALGGVALT